MSLFSRRQWLTSFREALAAAHWKDLDYPIAKGSAVRGATIASYLNRSRATAAPSRAGIVCNGSSQGVNLLCQVFHNRGIRRVAVPGYAEQCTGIREIGLETRENGKRRANSILEISWVSEAEMVRWRVS